jgi:aminoglycoside phosphotransferase (APT) family kinase protein
MFGECDVRRRQALRGAGLDPDLAMTRAASNANEVWIGDELVVRINPTAAGRLAREATVAARAAREALVPPIVELGNDGAIEWSVSRRASGGELGRMWKTMTRALRQRAIDELAAALAALHATPTDGLDAPDLWPPHTLPLEPLRRLIAELAAAHPEHEALLAACDAFVTARWPAFDAADRGLAHGDPHLENVLWNGAHVTALLDLEWARPTWLHADLETLLAIADEPRRFASADHEASVERADYADVPRWLRAAYPRLFAHPRLVERLAVLRVSRELGLWSDHPQSYAPERLLTAVT